MKAGGCRRGGLLENALGYSRRGSSLFGGKVIHFRVCVAPRHDTERGTAMAEKKAVAKKPAAKPAPKPAAKTAAKKTAKKAR